MESHAILMAFFSQLQTLVGFH